MSIYSIAGKLPLRSGEDGGIENNDPSLNGEMACSFLNEFKVNVEDFSRFFLSKYEMDYVARHCYLNHLDLRVVTHPSETNTCFEKAELLGSWDPLSVIKALYFEYSIDHALYAVVIPETGCFINRARLKELLNLPGDGFLKKANVLPRYMSFGTCSPFIAEKDLKVNGGEVERIIFDSEALEVKKEEGGLDDFSFGLDHRMSLQMNYNCCFEMLRGIYPDIVVDRKVLNLCFNEKLVRNNGKVNISYEFQSLNYRTAKFINSIHGYGDVTIINDYIDELNLPRILNATHAPPSPI